MKLIIENFKVEVVPYSINKKFEISNAPRELRGGECLYYVNYFGIKDKYISSLIKKFGNRLVVDDSQAFFRKNTGREISFNSVRKYFGVTDGAYLFANCQQEVDLLDRTEFHDEYLHLRELGENQLAYRLYLEHEARISSSAQKVSSRSEDQLSQINYTQVAGIRRKNYEFLYLKLQEKNQLDLEVESQFVPLYYPYLPREAGVKQKLLNNEVYVPTLWPELLTSNEISSWEKKISTELCFLPIDQRYSVVDMKEILKRV